MGTRTEANDGAFNEMVALLLRNEEEEKHAADVEMDMQRLLMLARDAHVRDQFVQVQGVRRVTLIAKSASSVVTKRLCAGILGNLAHSERGRLSASSCDRWHCVSHRHQCPLSMLLVHTNNNSDQELARVSAAALLAFSTQNHCQRHLDTLSGIPVLLTLLDVKLADGAATDVAIYSAAVLWNLCKAPALLLKLETTYGMLKDHLVRKLTNLLVTPLEPFQLFLTPTGERGMPFLLDFDGENLSVLVTASISTQLNVVLSIQNYVGRVRSLTDQFRPKNPPASAVVRRSKTQGGSFLAALDAGTSVAHYNESGMLAARTCAVCAKLIHLARKSSRRKQVSLLCSRDGCGQMYHLSCSRWTTLSEEAIAEIAAQAGKPGTNFYCDACMYKTPLCFWDFLAAHAQHELLLTENIFKSIGIARISPTPTPMISGPESMRSYSKSTESDATQLDLSHNVHQGSAATKHVADVDQADHSPWPSVVLFDHDSNLVGVGEKCFHIPASSRDWEMYIVTVTYATIRAYPATRQERAIPKKGESSVNNTMADSNLCKWQVSYARQGALENPVKPGNAVFWPASFTRDILAREYSRRSLVELENAFLYEFQGEQPQDKTFSVGGSILQYPAASSVTLSSLAPANSRTGVWMALTPRKGICMKLVATQLGLLKKLEEVHILHTKKSKPTNGGRKLRKPHFSGQQLNKIAVDTNQ